jgi:hypothetical protein
LTATWFIHQFIFQKHNFTAPGNYEGKIAGHSIITAQFRADEPSSQRRLIHLLAIISGLTLSLLQSSGAKTNVNSFRNILFRAFFINPVL